MLVGPINDPVVELTVLIMVPPPELDSVAEMMDELTAAASVVLPWASNSRFCCSASLCCFNCISNVALSCAALTVV